MTNSTKYLRMALTLKELKMMKLQGKKFLYTTKDGGALWSISLQLPMVLLLLKKELLQLGKENSESKENSIFYQMATLDISI